MWDASVGELPKADRAPGMMQLLTLLGMKLHLLNTEVKSKGTLSPVTHVAVTEQFLSTAVPQNSNGLQKSCGCLGSYEKVNCQGLLTSVL